MTSLKDILQIDDNIASKSYSELQPTIAICPWIDKYRPHKLKNIVCQDQVIKVLKKSLITGELPHIVLTGPSGTGKTSTIKALVRELFGPLKYNERVMELNASDERGINIVRNKIQPFAKTKTSGKDPNYLCPDYKVIILDEADAMTSEAQSALRKTMENYSHITRFCFICNYINQITEPILSRCAKFRFTPLNNNDMKIRLEKISINEKLNIPFEYLDILIDSSKGDMRKAIMLLQNTKYIENINKNDIYKLCCKISDNVLDTIINICTDDDTTIKKIVCLTKKIQSLSYPIQNILEQLTDKIINNDIYDDCTKYKIMTCISDAENALSSSGDEYIQLLYIFSTMYENRKKL